MSDDDTDRPALTPENLDRTHLPEQTMYRVRTAADGDSDAGAVRSTPLVVRTNEFRLLYFEMEPGETIDWHTHAPGLDEVNYCLEGRARYTLERADGSHQTLDVGPGEFVYLPGGARHKLEAVGDSVHRSLSAARFDTVARLEDLEDANESGAGDADGTGGGDADGTGGGDADGTGGGDADGTGGGDANGTGAGDGEWGDALFVDRKRDEVVARDDRYVST
ncbi:cupin domain-containing protein [Halobacterium yunchengense]|uniref:cupin domain-containing protein n=1 Tax=Halobacterium yunchengense TaxID=3108497 RepID=UPI0030087F25